jgi:hypothetical protein
LALLLPSSTQFHLGIHLVAPPPHPHLGMALGRLTCPELGLISKFSLVPSKVRPFRKKKILAYKQNKANLDPFHMCFTISL